VHSGTRFAEGTLAIALEWILHLKAHQVESLVVKGNCKFSPVAGPDGKLEVVEGEVAKQADGNFQFPIRRNSTEGAVGSYPEFLQAIGEVVGMAIVDEADERPAKQDFFWRYANKLIPGLAPLDPALEKTFLDSLSIPGDASLLTPIPLFPQDSYVCLPKDR